MNQTAINIREISNNPVKVKRILLVFPHKKKYLMHFEPKSCAGKSSLQFT